MVNLIFFFMPNKSYRHCEVRNSDRCPRNKHNKLKIVFSNVRSLSNKFDELLAFAEDVNPVVIVLAYAY